MSKAMVRRYGILLALIVINVLASTSITNGYPTTAFQEHALFTVSQWSWNVLWVWAVICVLVPFWSPVKASRTPKHSARGILIEAAKRQHPSWGGR